MEGLNKCSWQWPRDVSKTEQDSKRGSSLSSTIRVGYHQGSSVFLKRDICRTGAVSASLWMQESQPGPPPSNWDLKAVPRGVTVYRGGATDELPLLQWVTPYSHSDKELITLRRPCTEDMEAEGDLVRRRAPLGATESHNRNVWNCQTAKNDIYAIYMCTHMYKWKSCIHVHNVYIYTYMSTHTHTTHIYIHWRYNTFTCTMLYNHDYLLWWQSYWRTPTWNRLKMKLWLFHAS